MKVLHIIETLGSGGAERLLFTNLRHLGSKDVSSSVVTVFERGTHWAAPVRQLGIEVESLRLAGYSDIFKGVRLLRSKIKAVRPDLLHTHLWSANVIGRIAGKLSGVPVISSVHNPEYENETIANFSRSQRAKVTAARVADVLTARFACDRMVAVSKYVQASAARSLAYPVGQIDVIYNPVDFDAIVGHALDDMVDATFRGPSTKLLLTVGRVSPQKGLIYAVKAMSKILKSQPDTQLVCLGSLDDNEYVELIRGEIGRLGLGDVVHLLGDGHSVAGYLATADVFVFPSLYEGLGIALGEAMAAGLPCVASRIRPLDEFVVDGVNGILVSPRDSDALAASVLELLASEESRRELGSRAAATARELFDPETAVDKLARLYETVANARGK